MNAVTQCPECGHSDVFKYHIKTKDLTECTCPICGHKWDVVDVRTEPAPLPQPQTPPGATEATYQVEVIMMAVPTDGSAPKPVHGPRLILDTKRESRAVKLYHTLVAWGLEEVRNG